MCATLFTVAFPDNKKKNGKNIREVSEPELLKRFAAENIKKAKFVTDEGSNVIAALKDYTSLKDYSPAMRTYLLQFCATPSILISNKTSHFCFKMRRRCISASKQLVSGSLYTLKGVEEI